MFETPWHFHEEYELVWCEKGFGKKFIGNAYSEYSEGDLVFIGKNLPHLFKADEVFYAEQSKEKPSSIVLQFKEDFLGRHFFSIEEMAKMKKILSDASYGIEILGETSTIIKRLMHLMITSDSAFRLSLLIQIFAILSNSQNLRSLSVTNMPTLNNSDFEKMNIALSYAEAQFKSDISISEVALMVNLSDSAFCRYFKSRTQQTFISYVIDLRLNEAQRLLKKTNLTVLEICYESGFKNLSNFNKLFRKHLGVNPRKFRSH